MYIGVSSSGSVPNHFIMSNMNLNVLHFNPINGDNLSFSQDTTIDNLIICTKVRWSDRNNKVK